MKNKLENYLICKLYQVNSQKGYIKLAVLHSKCESEITHRGYIKDKTGNYNKLIEEIGTIIVKKSKIFNNRLAEIITGEKFDIITIDYNPESYLDIYRYTADGVKNEYDTFIIASKEQVTNKILSDYFNKNSNKEKYSEYLKNLKRNGLDAHKLKLIQEKEELLESNKKLIKNNKKNI